MRLADYLAMPGQNASDLARRCDVAVSTITRVSKGAKSPSLSLMERIRDATKGAVRPDDFLPPYLESVALQPARV